MYETPSYGRRHFSLCHFGSKEQAKAPIKNPKWVDELHKKQQIIDLVMKFTLFIFDYLCMWIFVLVPYVPFQNFTPGCSYSGN